MQTGAEETKSEEGAGEGKIKGLSRDARQVIVCTSFFREARKRARDIFSLDNFGKAGARREKFTRSADDEAPIGADLLEFLARLRERREILQSCTAKASRPRRGSSIEDRAWR